ncbi:MAG: phasin family protein [Isosphaeraceae bacterium]
MRRVWAELCKSPNEDFSQKKGRIMFDIVKQAVFTGLGLASLTREKAEQLAAEVARRAKLSEEESKAFQNELAARTAQAHQELEAEIDRRIDHAFIQLGIIKAGAKKEGEAAQAALRSAIDARVEDAIQRLGLARADDLQALTIRFDALERKLAAK